MPREWARPSRKKRTREHIIADLSANHTERYVLRCGFTVERVVHDYGVDLYMFTYNENGEAENGVVLFQLKATDHLTRRADGQAIVIRVKHSDLDWWVNEPMPVILVVYEAQADVAYWLYVQAFFKPRVIAALKKRTVTVTIPAANVLNDESIRRFTDYKTAVLAQVQRLRHHD